ncbi:MAG: 5/3-nucleotidase SurE [Planctomycetota bacterium]|jgi:5'-nucleotidase
MILLVNDDGVDAPGLRALYAALRTAGLGPVLAVAPAQERSGQSHAITIGRPLRVEPRHEAGFFAFAVDGTPADCVKVALDGLCPRPPDLVVSGVNDGPNAGRSIFYSGTLGAAMEAVVLGRTALAVSRARGEGGFAPAAAAAAGWAARLLAARPGPLLVNLNLPAGPASAWREPRLCRHGLGGFREGYIAARDRDGRPGWLLNGTWEPGAADLDAALLSQGHPTATLLRPDLNGDQAILAGLAEA